MEEDIDQFFSERNTVTQLTEKDFAQTGNYLKVAEAFARLTYASVYVINYQTRGFEFVSDNPLFLAGLTPAEVQEMGYAFYFRHVVPEDLELLLKINEVGFAFFENIPVSERIRHSITYDFRIVNEKKTTVLINHRLTPIYLTEDGKIWKAMCLVSLSNNTTSGNIAIDKQGSSAYWEYDLAHNRWNALERAKLTARDKEILQLSSQGLSITQIAEKIYVSADTVKFHRRKLFDKLGVQNITEALAYTTSHKML